MGFCHYLVLLCFLVFLPTGKPDLVSEKAALLAFQASVGRYVRWNQSSPTPCSWQGVQCSNNTITELRLPGSYLSGVIPMGIFGNLTNLRTLSLRLNSLSGQLPSDLAVCTQLRNIYLQNNNFSGAIPDSIFGLNNLVRLDLSQNNFSGEISPKFNNLTRLGTLYLQYNQLTGSIPDLSQLQSLDLFNVSYNHLNGSIPSSLRNKNASAFIGNSLCGGPLLACSGEASPPTSSSGGSSGNNNLSGGAIAGIVIGSVVGVLLILLILFFLCRRKSNGKTGSVDTAPAKQGAEVEIQGEKRESGSLNSAGGGGGGGAAAAAAAAATTAATTTAVAASNRGVNSSGSKKLIFFGNAARVFDLEDLLRASAEVLGKGTFGTAYKAVLDMGTVMAVKRLKDVAISEKEFKEKIEVVGSMDHENLVPLRAYYYSKEEKLLVYDFMLNGSLSALLHGNRGSGRTPLNWETRSGIALGAARGIEYLHGRGPKISHGNIKSSNILLTKSYEACVSDFGLASLVGATSTANRVAGYRAPEVTDAHKVSQKADIYSFGVLLLELLTGKPPTHTLTNEDGVDLPRWVQSVIREEWTSEVFDPELLRYQNVEEEMVQLLQLATDCCAQYPDKRPSMTEVTRRIEELRRSSVSQGQDPQLDMVELDDGSSRQTN
ncbi:hypothetical protein NE237_007466 [Protea cynaroides]|uniref:Protein kinase domain-containing protein n=1 Tax=Protea cynaroides TaxID=273540 RepID=A0A9Q0QWE7_9MAGN|nr:hypothetical protein NE237_007466 [Protea cynaroides]